MQCILHVGMLVGMTMMLMSVYSGWVVWVWQCAWLLLKNLLHVATNMFAASQQMQDAACDTENSCIMRMATVNVDHFSQCYTCLMGYHALAALMPTLGLRCRSHSFFPASPPCVMCPLLLFRQSSPRMSCAMPTP